MAAAVKGSDYTQFTMRDDPIWEYEAMGHYGVIKSKPPKQRDDTPPPPVAAAAAAGAADPPSPSPKKVAARRRRRVRGGSSARRSVERAKAAELTHRGGDACPGRMLRDGTVIHCGVAAPRVDMRSARVADV
eukprot:gene3332-7312_t